MKLDPRGDRIVVRRDVANEKSEGGILLPEKAKEVPLRGTVIAAGADSRLNVQDRVLFTAYAGNEQEINGEKLLIMRADDVLCVIEDE